MTNGNALRILCFSLLAVIACSDDNHSLTVKVLSDHPAGFDVNRAELTVLAPGGASLPDVSTSLSPQTPLWEGLVLNTYTNTPPGDYDVAVTLWKDDRQIGAGRVRRGVRGETTVTVVITADCSGVDCSTTSLLACLAGTCVDERCSPETSEFCPPGCENDESCPAGPACTIGRCIARVCLYVPDATMECVVSDAGVDGASDASSDGGSEPEFDASIDAAMDASVDAFVDAAVDAEVDLGADAAMATPISLCAGHVHTCAAFRDGRVKCWGRNHHGQLGLEDLTARGGLSGEIVSSFPFVNLGEGVSAASVSCGEDYSCALTTDGRVKCWGINNYGQLGLGTTVPRGGLPGTMGDALSFIDFGAGRTVRELATGGDHACVILDDDSLRCWGRNANGELGRGNTSVIGDGDGEMGDALPAVDLGDGRRAVHVATGYSFTCALLDDARVKCWGFNEFGQLGLGDRARRGDGPGEMGDALPTVPLGTGRTAVAIATSSQHVCAILDNDTVKCWGNNELGELGLGDADRRGDDPGELGDMLAPVDLGEGARPVSVECGRHASCVVRADGRAKCWGNGAPGQLGTETSDNRGDGPGELGDAQPHVMIGTGLSIARLSMGPSNGGSTHVCAALTDGRAKCWGWNAYGQLGLGLGRSFGSMPEEMGDSLPFLAIP